MNEIIRQLHERKSVRIFEDKQVEDNIKAEILSAAVSAPTAGCQQLYTIIDITEQSVKDRLAVSCDDQPFIARAPLVLIFCADALKWYNAYIEAGAVPRKPGEGDLLLAVSDALIAAQNAVAAAHSLGLGSCYIGDIMENCEVHRELLKLPRYVFPAAMLVFGYPTEHQLQRTKPQRVDMKHIVHNNTYRQMDGGELRDMLSGQTGTEGFEKWCGAFCDRKYNSTFACEMTRSVREYLKDFN